MTKMSNNSKQSNQKTRRDEKNHFVPKKEKFNPITYKMNFIGTKEDLEENIPSYVVPAFKSLGIDLFNAMEISLDEMAAKMFEVFMHKMPEMIPHGKNSYWSLTYASNRISLKTDTGYQFGWVINYDKRRTDYTSVDFFCTIYSQSAFEKVDNKKYTTFWSIKEQ